MASNKVYHVDSCKLGMLRSDGVALQIKFAVDAAALKEGTHQEAVFGMSHQVAKGLVQALTALLEAPAKPKRTQN